MGYVPEDVLSVALTINGYNYPINRIFFLVWGILYGTGAPLPSFSPVPLTGTTATPLVGVYSADAYGLTVTIRDAGAALTAQVKGEDEPFALTYIGRNRFLADEYGILVEFADPVDGASPRFTLYQQQSAIPLVRTTGSK